MSKVVDISNQIHSLRSQIADLMQADSNNLTSNNKAEISLRRSKLSQLEDELYVAKMQEGFSGTSKRSNAPAQRSYSKADQTYALKRYLMGNPLAETRDILTSNDGGFTIPQSTLNIVDALKFYGNIAGEVDVYNGAGYIKQPIVDDTANSVKLVGEGASSTSAESDPSSFSSALIPQQNGTITTNSALVTNIDVSVQELYNGIPDFDAWLRSRIFTRIARGVEGAVTNAVDGSGTALPACPTGGYLIGIPQGAVNATVNVITSADLSALKASIDPAHLQGASWFASESVWNYVDAMVDSTGRRLWNYDGQGNLIVHGLPFKRCVSMPALTSAAGSKLVILGNHKLAYKISLTQPSVRVIKELPNYAENLIVRYQAVTRIGACQMLSSSTKALVQA